VFTEEIMRQQKRILVQIDMWVDDGVGNDKIANNVLRCVSKVTLPQERNAAAAALANAGIFINSVTHLSTPDKKEGQ
jgi:hypothetical protein